MALGGFWGLHLTRSRRMLECPQSSVWVHGPRYSGVHPVAHLEASLQSAAAFVEAFPNVTRKNSARAGNLGLMRL